MVTNRENDRIESIMTACAVSGVISNFESLTGCRIESFQNLGNSVRLNADVDGKKTMFEVIAKESRTAKSGKLSPNQTEAANVLSQYVGKIVEVLTSSFTANVNPEAIRNSVGTFQYSTLRGLESKGYIRIVSKYWKGAKIEIIRTLSDS